MIEKLIHFLNQRTYKEYSEREDTALRRKKPNARLAAVLILLLPNQDDYLIPFIVKPQRERVHGGQIAFPGGREEPEDDDLKETALRETFEEIGIVSSDIKVIGLGPMIDVFASNHLVKPVYALYTGSTPISYKPNTAEVEELLELPLSEFQLTGNSVKHYIEQYKIHVPAYRIKTKIVWGASAKIMEHFLQALQRATSKGQSTQTSL